MSSIIDEQMLSINDGIRVNCEKLVFVVSREKYLFACIDSMLMKPSGEIDLVKSRRNRFFFPKKLFIFLAKSKILKIWFFSICSDSDFDDDGLETLKRYKPRSLDELASRTKFSKKEIQLIYQGFKQECPSGKTSPEENEGPKKLVFLFVSFRCCQWGNIQTYLQSILSVCWHINLCAFDFHHIRFKSIWLCDIRRFSHLFINFVSWNDWRSTSLDF